MTKITLADTLMDIFMKLSEGNPGALTVLMELYKHGAEIDPDAGDPILLMLNLDSLNLYGPNIWVLFKDVCGENLTKFIACLRGWQLGHITHGELHDVIQACMDQRVSCTKEARPKFDVDAVYASVKAELPNFNKEVV